MNGFQRIGPLFTDLYELTMAASYFDHEMFIPATFSLYARGYPPQRSYYVSAGLDDVLSELEIFRFTDDEIDYIRKLDDPRFPDSFIDYLKEMRFTGNVFAVPEGDFFFANEPVMEISGSLIETQILETFVINTIGLQSNYAMKASRCVHAAKGRKLVDFALRRTPGQDAGLKLVRASYIAGFDGTSNVLGGKLYNIPVSGTMAHSYVMSFKNEADSFRAYAKSFPDHSVFLIDTYDTIEGARVAVEVAGEMKKNGKNLQGVRLDSGDMAKLSIEVRKILDDAGFDDVLIFASSGFDEHKIEKVLNDGGKIDAFGVGTKLGTVADAPYLDMVYKLVKVNGRDVRKYSPDKITLGGEKQIYRFLDETDKYEKDVIGTRDETFDKAFPVMKMVMEGGKRMEAQKPLEEIRENFMKNFSRLPERYKNVEEHVDYPVEISDKLQKIQERIAEEDEQ